jgi:hypothetical protein
VDIHVRRLRAKLGDQLPLETLRGSGYKLRTPAEEGFESEGSETPPAPSTAPVGDFPGSSDKR